MAFVLNITANKHTMRRREIRCLLCIEKKQAGFDVPCNNAGSGISDRIS